MGKTLPAPLGWDSTKAGNTANITGFYFCGILCRLTFHMAVFLVIINKQSTLSNAVLAAFQQDLRSFNFIAGIKNKANAFEFVE